MLVGKELDNLIHEKIMGEKPFRLESNSFDNSQSKAKPYSSDIGYAMLAMKKAFSPNLRWQIWPTEEGKVKFWAFRDHPADHDAVSAVGDQEAHAICLACLKTVSVS